MALRIAQEGELLETVLTDFMASVMHLCQKTGLISEDYNCFPALLQAAEIHFEQEQNESEQRDYAGKQLKQLSKNRRWKSDGFSYFN